MIGQIIGNIYQIVDKLGEGGMGSVYKGLDLNLQRPVAIKVLRPDLANNPALVERFHSEAITLAKLNHPNIATLYSFIPQDNQFFMIMEFVAGETLDKIISRGAINYQEAIPLFCQALEGIGQAHRAGIIHRDIKPANLMVMTEDFGEKKVKVMDFGIARILGTNRLTSPGGLVGTLHYMSPEQIKGQDIDTRSDIYALGIVLYEMLTGKLPFDANSEYALLDMHVKQPPPLLHLVKPDIPLFIEDVVVKSMAKSPNEQFQTVAEFRNCLLNQTAILSNIVLSSNIKETKLESISNIQETKIESIPNIQETKIEEIPALGSTRVETANPQARETRQQPKTNTQQGINQLTNSDNPLHINSPAQINYQLALQNQNKAVPPTEIVDGVYPKPDNFLKQHLIKIVAGTTVILIIVVGLTAKFFIFPSNITTNSPSPSPTPISTATVVTKLITTNPVEKEELLRVIKSNPTLQKQILKEIAELQFNFEMTSEVEQEFLLAGANKELIESMIKKSYVAPVPTPEPTATSVPTNNFPGGGDSPKVVTPNPPDNTTNSTQTTDKPKPSPKPLDIRPIPKPIDMAERLQRKKALENRLKRLVDELSETSDPVKREQIRKEVQQTNSELNKLK